MNVVKFHYFGKFGHFLRAEANANGVTYPLPPRTVLLGLVGAVLGMGKDEPQDKLTDAHLAVGGSLPKRFWHKTNVRKDPPAPLAFRVKASEKGTSKEQRNFRFPQEWLWRPSFKVWAALPEPYHFDFASRLREHRSHFLPCLGLSEMLAHLEWLGDFQAEPLPAGLHWIETVGRQDVGQVDAAAAFAGELTLQSLRMPSAVTAERVFSHRAYWVELQGRPYPVQTDQAWCCGQEVVAFL